MLEKEIEKPDIPIGFVIFGVTGDLTKRKLIPALYHLALADQLPEDFYIIGFARRDWTDEKMRKELELGVLEYAQTDRIELPVLNKLLDCMRYVRSSFDEDQGYKKLGALLKKLGADNRLLYLATPPKAYQTIARQLNKFDLNANEPGWTRIVIEKPYGFDLESSQELDRVVHSVFTEEQVYRIDHYLGKETVQNILVFRFANGIFEPLWNRKYIDNIQITVAETVGVGSRAGYYETAGVIRDMFQNHMLQLLALTAMEAPVTFSADAVRDEKVKVLRALAPMSGAEGLAKSFRSQYVAGNINGERVQGYKDEPDVPDDSITETLLALKLEVSNWRWAGVPFYIRSGKRFPRRVTEIAIQFKQIPISLFGWKNLAGDAPNTLVLNIQPEQGISLAFGAKKPGPINLIEPVEMSFSYAESFMGNPPEAYERLMLDCMNGDATLFTRADEVKEAWRFTTDIINSWEGYDQSNLPVYEAGTWGPPLLDDFIEEDGRKWMDLDRR